MVHAWAEHHCEDEEEGNTRIECPCNDRVETCLADGAYNCEEGTQEVKLSRLRSSKTKESKWHHAELDDTRVDASVCPTADGILRRVLPGL